MKAKVLVRPKKGILDPQGEAVANALRHLGFHVGEARVGRLVELQVESASLAEANEAVAKMCDQLLANPLIETCEFEVTE